MTVRLVEVPQYGSDEWVAIRSRGLGASELATVVGVNPWQGEYELWSLKHGASAAFAGNWPTRLGHHMEELGVKVWEERNERPAVRGETFTNDRWPDLWATLDARSDAVAIEIKWSGREWGDDLPAHIRVQALAQIGIAGLAACDVVRLGPRSDPTIIRVERDDALIANLLDLSEAWWARHVIGGEEPPLDGSPAARKALDRMIGTEQREADERQVALLDELRRTRAALERLQEADERLVRDIKASMAGAGVLVAPALARVTWAPVKGRTTTDWRAVVTEAAVPVDVIERHTTTSEPTTRFAVKFEEEAPE